MPHSKKPAATKENSPPVANNPDASDDVKDPTGKREESGRPKGSGYAEPQPVKKP